MSKREKIEALNEDLKTGRFLIGVDYGTEPATTVISTRCARCSATVGVEFGDLECVVAAKIAAHQERCLIVGDWLRFDKGNGRWIEGPVTTMRNEFGHPEICPERESGDLPGYMGKGYSFTWPDKIGNIRRIPRPQQGEAVRVANAAYVSANQPPRVNVVDDMPSDAVHYAAPVLYDGLTAEQCLERWTDRQREEYTIWKDGEFLPVPMTADQLTAARDLWSTQLRARIAARAESERLTVRVDLQDVEDLAW